MATLNWEDKIAPFGANIYRVYKLGIDLYHTTSGYELKKYIDVVDDVYLIKHNNGNCSLTDTEKTICSRAEEINTKVFGYKFGECSSFRFYGTDEDLELSKDIFIKKTVDKINHVIDTMELDSEKLKEMIYKIDPLPEELPIDPCPEPSTDSED